MGTFFIAHAIFNVMVPLLKPELNEKSDEVLMDAVAQGDAHALGYLYLRHNGAVRAMIGYVAPGMNSHDVDDATQEVFLSLGKAAKSYRHQSLFKSFLFRIAARRARDWQRGTWLRFQRLRKDSVSDAPLKMMQTEFGPGKKAVLRQTVRQVMASLSYSHREVLVLHVTEGFTCSEIAEILSIRPKTVRTRLHRARNAILQHKNASVWQDAMSEMSS